MDAVNPNESVGTTDNSERLRTFKRRIFDMKQEWQTWRSHYQEISDFFCPRTSRFLLTDANRGDKKNTRIYDNTATNCVRDLVAAFMSMHTSPARPWFKHKPKNYKLRFSVPVLKWLEEIDEVERSIIYGSNFYAEAAKAYEQTILYGTAAMYVERDPESIINCKTFPVGSYYLSKGRKGKIDTFAREYQMSVGELVKEFGIDNVSEAVKTQYQNKSFEKKYDVQHLIHPNEDYVPGSINPSEMKFKSCYWESASPDKMLREAGYNWFPILAPRWMVTGEDTYGRSPAMDCLGPVKALQLYEKKSAKATDKMVDPPTQADESQRRNKIKTDPDSQNYVSNSNANSGIRAIYQIQFDLQAAEMKSERCRQTIRDTLYSHLLTQLTNNRRSDTTAEEVRALQDEKLTLIGPVLEQFDDEFLSPFLEMVFGEALEFGMIPDPPQEASGMDFEPEYVSVMAQAMQMVGLSAMDRALAVTGQVGGVYPTAMDMLKPEPFLREYYSRLGISANYISSEEEVAQASQQRAEAQAQAQQLAATQQQVEIAKTMSETKLKQDSGLDQIIANATGA
jgi:hypothetical protein